MAPNPGLPSDGTAGTMTSSRRPYLLEARSSKYYYALVTGMGLLTDLCLFGLYTPAIPFRLEALGYTQVSSLTGWLGTAYAGGLIIATVPFSWAGSTFKGKRLLLLLALALMAVGVIIMWFVESYAAMVVARALQGASGSGIWTLGLALVADNVEDAKLGRIMGLSMIGYAFGLTIGQTIGGILYEQLGWVAPNVFAIILVSIDCILRLLVLEKHEITRWHSPASVPAPIPLLSTDVALVQATEETDIAVASDLALTQSQDDKDPRPAPSQPRSTKSFLSVITYLLFNPRPLTGFLISFVNGYIGGGIGQTALVLRLAQRYGLNSLGAGLVYLAIAVPSAIVSPLSGRLTDKFGPRPLSLICLFGYLPPLCLLMIDQLPLAAFITILCFLGMSAGLVNSPVMVFLRFVVHESKGRVTSSHIYGGFNIFFSFGAFLGPLIDGQLLGNLAVPTGWQVVLGLTVAIAASCIPLAFLFMKVDRSAPVVGDQDQVVHV